MRLLPGTRQTVSSSTSRPMTIPSRRRKASNACRVRSTLSTQRRVAPVRWTVHGERTLYDSDWMRLTLVDVELPSGERFEHHVVRFPEPASATVVRDSERGILLLRRHRFTVDSFDWEV